MLLNVKCKVKFVIKIPHKKKISQLPSREGGGEGPLFGLPSDKVIQHPASGSSSDDLFVKFLEKHTDIQLLYRPADAQAGFFVFSCFFFFFF